jgi:hypothetical protein
VLTFWSAEDSGGARGWELQRVVDLGLVAERGAVQRFWSVEAALLGGGKASVQRLDLGRIVDGKFLEAVIVGLCLMFESPALLPACRCPLELDPSIWHSQLCPFFAAPLLPRGCMQDSESPLQGTPLPLLGGASRSSRIPPFPEKKG